MVSKFINNFKSTDGDEQRAFQQSTLAILKELHPDRDLTISDDPNILLLGDTPLGITNLRAGFLLTSQSDDDLRKLVAKHFEAVWSNLSIASSNGITWDEAKTLLMPQLMPEALEGPLPVLSQPFGGGVLTGFVLDVEKAYTYVRAEDLDAWNVEIEDVYAAAMGNLEVRSKGIEIPVFEGQNGFAVIATMDSYDAVRILLLKLRETLGGYIGLPFYFGVPNRDFLICWSNGADDDFQLSMKGQVALDNRERPYPLSPAVFEATAAGDFLIVEVEPDPRALNADLN